MVFIVDDESRHTFQVHRRAMVDPEVLEAERTKVFDSSWLYAGHESEIATAGDYVSRTVGGRSLVLCRDMDGVVRVWLNTCTHRGATVCRESRG